MAAEHKLYPLGEPGQMAAYQHESEGSLPNAVVKTLTVAIGAIEEKAGVPYQWICLRATKISGEKFAVWLLSESFPSADLKVSRVHHISLYPADRRRYSLGVPG